MNQPIQVAGNCLQN